MEGIAGKIELYHKLFQGCTLAAVCCLILAVVLFFLLDIRSVLGYLTGRRAKRQIQKLEEINASSGRLRARERSNMQYVAQEMKEDMGVRDSVSPGARKVDHVVEEADPPSSREETELLQQEDVGVEETALLQQDIRTDGGDGSTAFLEPGAVAKGSFKIEREILLIHAEEVI